MSELKRMTVIDAFLRYDAGVIGRRVYVDFGNFSDPIHFSGVITGIKGSLKHPHSVEFIMTKEDGVEVVFPTFCFITIETFEKKSVDMDVQNIFKEAYGKPNES